MDKENKTLGSRILKLLKDRGMTRKEFASALGVSESMVSRYISDISIPGIRTLEKMTNVLDTTADFLLDGQITHITNDFELGCYQIQMLVSRFASQMSQKQKDAIVANIIASSK